MPVKTAAQPSPGAHPAGAEADPRHAPAQPEAGDRGTVGAGIYALRGEPVASDAPGGTDSGEEGEGKEVQAKAV